jgi:large subunit ribosomal protein L15
LAQRGFSNHPFKKEVQIVNLGEIEKRYEDGETVNAVTLIRKGLVKGTLKDGAVRRLAAPVKILGDGDFSKKLSFKVGALSASAREKIEKAGGSVIAAAVSGGNSRRSGAGGTQDSGKGGDA